MDIKGFLESGIAERYCLAVTTEEENKMICELRAAIPEIDEEINRITVEINNAQSNLPLPLQRVKYKLMRTVYEAESKKNLRYLPLMDMLADPEILNDCLLANGVTQPGSCLREEQVIPLPSTNEIENFAVWLIDGLPEEVHYGSNEYVVIMSGACSMNIGGTEKFMGKGEMICIPPGILHSAKVTSSEPLFAIVQRQLIAA